MKMVKVFIAVKRKLQPGDKMAGRHGNKGVVSRVVPVEDMPFLDDGTSVDLVLNPLGVPSRMNVGQILETHLGWACAHARRSRSASWWRSTGAPARGARSCWSGCATSTASDEFARRRSRTLDTDAADGAVRQPEEGRADRDAGVRRRAHVRHRGACWRKAGLDTSGQVVLVDGRTGEPFERKVTVGYIYMLKLHHLVDDKIHARSHRACTSW